VKTLLKSVRLINVASNVLSCKRENKSNDNVPLTTEETLLKSVRFRQDKNKEKNPIALDSQFWIRFEEF
jgi:hypothetical protein